MEYNTNHLGYKFFSGQLRGNRKNSEQVNKFLAGFFDADGSVYYSLDNKGYGELRAKVTQSAKNDPDGKLLKGLQEYYELGNVYFYDRGDNKAYSWELSAKHSKMLFNRIGKHLYIKQKHFQSMIDFFDNKLKDNVKDLVAASRAVSCSMTHKKHISPAYLAGLIAGDGYIKVILGKSKFSKRTGRYHITNELRFVIVLHEDDRQILDKITLDYGGSVNTTNRGHTRWELSLGKGNKQAHKIIKSVMSYTFLDCKYKKLDMMHKFHEQLAETKQARLERVYDSPNEPPH